MRPQLAQSHSPGTQDRHRALDHTFARRLSGSVIMIAHLKQNMLINKAVP